MSGLLKLQQQTKKLDDPIGVLITDLDRAIKASNIAGAKKIVRHIGQSISTCPSVEMVNAAKWLRTEPPEPEQIIKKIIDVGDKLSIIGSSKQRKSFFLLQLCLCIASGKSFLSWQIPKPRSVVYVQLEIKAEHFHKRMTNLCHAANINTRDIQDRLHIINGRGLGLSGAEGINRILTAVEGMNPEVIVIDPLYKIAEGTENAAEDMKSILSLFDQLSADTGAAIIFVHHDAKGTPGDRDIRDRGAGSNVLSRDYDACISLSAHAQNEDAMVVDILLRNYAPQKSFSVLWSDDGEGYCFKVANDISPSKKTSRTKAPLPELSTYLPIAKSIIKNGEMEFSEFRSLFQKQSGLSDNRFREFISWAKDEGCQYFDFREERGRGVHHKWIKLKERVKLKRQKI